MPVNTVKIKKVLVMLALCGLTLLMTAMDCDYPAPRIDSVVAQYELKWSPDGSQIVFPYALNIFAVESDGSSIRRLTGGWTGTKDQTVENVSRINVSPDISPDGSQIAYTSFQEPFSFSIKTVKLKGWFKWKRTLAKNDGNDIYPVWSPDGTRIAFVSTRAKVRGHHIYTMAADGSDVTSIAPLISVSPVPTGTPAWSPDGTRLAFLGRGLEGERTDWLHLYIVGSDGSDLTQIGEAATRPAWSPDGLKVAFIGHIGEDVGLLTSALDGSPPTKLLDYPDGFNEAPRNLSWSPDGAQLLLSGSSSAVGVINADGSDFKKLTLPVYLAGHEPASWSPDGSRIAVNGSSRFLRNRDLNVEGAIVLVTMDPDGGNVQVLVRVGFSDLIAESDWEEPESDSGMNTGRSR